MPYIPGVRDDLLYRGGDHSMSEVTKRAYDLLSALPSRDWEWAPSADDDMGSIDAKEGGVVAFVPPFTNVRTYYKHGTHYSYPIARFIAASPRLVLDLLAEIERLRAENTPKPD